MRRITLQIFLLVAVLTFAARTAAGQSKEPALSLSKGESVSVPKTLKQYHLGAGQKVTWTSLVKGDKSTAMLIQARGRLKPHVHRTHDEFLYVISGKGELKVGDEVKKIKSGDLIYVPAGTIHEGFFEQAVSLLSVYSPEFDPENPDREWIGGSGP